MTTMNNEINELLTPEVTGEFVDELLSPVDALAVASEPRESRFFKAVDLDFEDKGFGVENKFNKSPNNVDALSLFTLNQDRTGLNRSNFGIASGAFNGDGGLYNIRVGYYDENDGQGKLSLSLTGGADFQSSITLDQDLDGAAPGPNNFVVGNIAEAIRIDSDTLFTVQGERGRSATTGELDEEGVRFASIEFIPVDNVEPPTPPDGDFAVMGMAMEDGPEVLVEIDEGKSTSTYNITSQTVNEKGMREGSIRVRPRGANDQLTIEAEDTDLTLDGFIRENRFPGISNIGLIIKNGDNDFTHVPNGRVSGTFSDVLNYEAGVYDIDVNYYDEGDGISELTFSLDGNSLDTWLLDNESTTRIPTPANRETRTVATGVSLIGETGFSIDAIQETQPTPPPSAQDRKEGKGNRGQEGARVDSLIFNRVTPLIFDPEDDFQDLGVGEMRKVTFGFSETDAEGNEIELKGVIEVKGVNDAPDAEDDVAMTCENESVEIDVLVNDSDIDNTDILKDPDALDAEDRPKIIDTLVVTQIEGSAANEVELASGAIVRRNDSTGKLEYDPSGQFNELLDGETATDTFEYTLEDGRGGSDTATVTVTIKGKGPGLILEDDANRIQESEPNPDPNNPATVSGNVLSNDESLRGTPQVIAINGQPVPENGALTISIPGSLAPLGTLTIDRNGEYTFSLNDDNPEVDGLNTGESLPVPSISYTVNNGFDEAAAFLNVTIDGITPPPDLPPVVTNDIISVREGNPIIFDIDKLIDGSLSGGSADFDPEATNLNIVSVDSTSQFGGTVQVTTDPQDGSTKVTYTAPLGYISHDLNGNSIDENVAPRDTFNYVVADSTGQTATGTVTALIQDSQFFVEEAPERDQINNCFSQADCERLRLNNVSGFNRPGEAVTIFRDGNFRSQQNNFAVHPDDNVPDDEDLRVQITGTLGRNEGRPEVDIFSFDFNKDEVVTFDVDTGGTENLDTHLFLFNQATVEYVSSSTTPTGLGDDPRINPLVDRISNEGAEDSLEVDDGSTNQISTPIDDKSLISSDEFISSDIFFDPFFEYTIPTTGTYYLGIATEDTDWNRDRGHFQSIAGNDRDFAGDYILNVSIENPQAIQLF